MCDCVYVITGISSNENEMQTVFIYLNFSHSPSFTISLDMAHSPAVIDDLECVHTFNGNNQIEHNWHG